jgi:hydrogenase expression/formation protein HypC
VGGCATPFLAELVPADFHGLGAHVIAYDSTFLPTGLVSAGGMIRQEDLLQVMAPLPAEEPPLPLLLLMHHHLIPTPLTDLSPIDSRAMPWLGRWFVSGALPWLVSNADREEMTMTALGAGTALSTLHALRRATLVLTDEFAHLIDGGDAAQIARLRRVSPREQPVPAEDDPVVPGDWVLIHVGFAMSKISEQDAFDQMNTLRALGEIDGAMQEVEGYGLENMN